VDENFIDLLKLQIIQGRNFSSSFPSDSSKAVLVNEAFVKMAGWKNPIGELVEMIPFGSEKKMVVGVVKDYHYASLKNAIEPQLFVASPTKEDKYRQVLIKIKSNSEANSLSYIEKIFKKLFPLTPYSYQFYDEINKKNYEAESKWKKVILLGALITIFIASIGLFGLSILVAEKRFKEIGIRKLLGASMKTIILTLSRDFLLLISLAMLIALPIAYYGGRTWLETYPYRTTIEPGIFFTTGLLVLLIALVTTSYQSIKVALINPVDALRKD
jgi:putative ABC transport system permease protein